MKVGHFLLILIVVSLDTDEGKSLLPARHREVVFRSDGGDLDHKMFKFSGKINYAYPSCTLKSI